MVWYLLPTKMRMLIRLRVVNQFGNLKTISHGISRTSWWLSKGNYHDSIFSYNIVVLWILVFSWLNNAETRGEAGISSLASELRDVWGNFQSLCRVWKGTEGRFKVTGGYLSLEQLMYQKEIFKLFGHICPSSSLLSGHKTYLFGQPTKMHKIDKIWEEERARRRAYVLPKSLLLHLQPHYCYNRQWRRFSERSNLIVSPCFCPCPLFYLIRCSLIFYANSGVLNALMYLVYTTTLQPLNISDTLHSGNGTVGLSGSLYCMIPD